MGQAATRSEGGGTWSWPSRKAVAAASTSSASEPPTSTLGTTMATNIASVSRPAASLLRLPSRSRSVTKGPCSATAMIAPHAIGNRKGETITKHQPTSSARLPSRIATSVARPRTRCCSISCGSNAGPPGARMAESLARVTRR